MGSKQDICYTERTTFVGQIKNEIFHGEGTLYHNDTGNVYKGEFKNGLKHGFGELHYYSGDKYIGEFYQDVIQGNGKYINNNGYIYEGQFTFGSLLGDGKIFNVSDELLYEGEFLNSLPHGFGKSYLNGTINYIGMWHQNYYHGYGLLIEDFDNKYGLYQGGILAEQINNIPPKFYKYINKNQKQIYDSDINLSKYKKSQLKPKYSVLASTIPTTSTHTQIVENPFNCVLLNPINQVQTANNNDFVSTGNALKSTFNPMKTRFDDNLTKIEKIR